MVVPRIPIANIIQAFTWKNMIPKTFVECFFFALDKRFDVEKHTDVGTAKCITYNKFARSFLTSPKKVL